MVIPCLRIVMPREYQENTKECLKFSCMCMQGMALDRILSFGLFENSTLANNKSMTATYNWRDSPHFHLTLNRCKTTSKFRSNVSNTKCTVIQTMFCIFIFESWVHAFSLTGQQYGFFVSSSKC